MMKKYIYIGSVLSLLMGCAPKVADHVIEVEVNESQAFNISRDFKEAKPIFLQFREDALVSFIGKIVLAEDRIFTENSYVTAVFSMPLLKRLLEKQRAGELTLPQWLVTKIEHSEEDANPLLLLYEVKMIFWGINNLE